MAISATYQKFFSIVIAIVLSASALGQEVSLHAHNDYLKKKPLFDALDQNIYSIEIDVFSTERGVVVAHTGNSLSSKPLLEELYILPLKKVLDAGTIKSQLSLVFDIKNGGEKTCTAVMNVLNTHLFKHRFQLRILFTGGYGKDFRKNFMQWNIVFDHNLESYLKTGVIPDYSGRFSNSYSTFKSYYKSIPKDTMEKRFALANMMGLETRVWAAGNSEKTWDFIVKLGFNTLNVDDYKKARKFIHNIHSIK